MNDTSKDKRRALGRGLSALISAKPVSVKSTTVETSTIADVVNYPSNQTAPSKPNENLVEFKLTSSLEPSSVQPRQFFDEAELNELAQSIKNLGILQPILVRKAATNQFEIIAGERRWRAAKIAKLEQVPVIIKDFTDEEASEVAIIENVQRSNLNPLEEARAYQALSEKFNLSQQQIADKVGKDRSSISNIMRILSLPQEVQDLLQQDKISLGHAKALLSVKEPTAQKSLAQKIVQEKLSVRELESIVTRSVSLKKPRGNKAKLTRLSDFPEVNDRLRQKLGTRTNIQSKGDGSGKITIDYFSSSDLDRIIERICD